MLDMSIGVGDIITIAVLVIGGVVAWVKLRGDVANRVTNTECLTRHADEAEKDTEFAVMAARNDEQHITLFKAIEAIREGGHAHANPHPRNEFPEWPEEEDRPQ